MGFIITYQTIFELSVWHHHFLDSPSAGNFIPPPSGATPPDIIDRLLDYDLQSIMDIRLSPDSEKTVARKGLIFKKSRRGCLLSARNSLAETDPSVKLTLLLLLRDPAFLGYSNFGPPAVLEHPIFYLSNRNTVPGVLISNDTTPVLNNGFREIWSPRVFRLLKTNPADTTATINVFEHTSSSPDPALTLSLVSEANQLMFELDCRSLPEGLYRFESPGKITTTRRFLGLESMGGVFGVAEIFLDALSNGRYHLNIE